MTEPASPTPPLDPNSLQKLFNDWWQFAGGAIATIAGVAGSGLSIPPPYNTWIASAIFLAGLTLLFFYSKRARSRREAETRRKDAEERLKSQAAAFRMLQRYRVSDILPGDERRRQGDNLRLKIKTPEFRLVVVVGESGAGKSSLLEASLATKLQKENFTVALFNNILRLPDVALGATAKDVLHAFTLEEVKQLKNKTPDSKVVYIIDQFEELLSRFRSKADRQAIGVLLQARIAGGVGIVIGLRKEYLAELQDVLSQLSFSVGYHETFQVYNFDPKEAEDVIRECAETDGLALDPALPALIVRDLTVDDRIRPADLQIICGMLSGELTVPRYEKEGGAVGLQSRFILSVIDVTGDPLLARTILRELCDIPNNKKAAEALTSEQLADRARDGAAGDRATPANVESVLRALNDALMLVKDSTFETARWSLIHDYLVRPIAVATELETKSSEAASRMLDYYVAQAKTKRRTVIPLADLITIRRDVPSAKRRQPNVHTLISRSLVYGYGGSFAKTAGVIAAVFVFFIILTTQSGQWRDSNPLNHWTDAERTAEPLTATAMTDKDGHARIAIHTSTFGQSSKRITTWLPETGELLSQYTGHLSIAGNKIWDFDIATSTLKRLATPGIEAKSLTLSDAGWDDLIVNQEIGDNSLKVTWSEPESSWFKRWNDFDAINFSNGKITNLTSNALAPPGLSADASNSVVSADISPYAQGEVVSSERLSRFSIWNESGDVIYTEDFKDGAMVQPIDSISIGKTTYFVLGKVEDDQTSFKTFKLTMDRADPAKNMDLRIEARPWVADGRLTAKTLRSGFIAGPRLTIAGATKIWMRGSADHILIIDPVSSSIVGDIPTVNLRVTLVQHLAGPRDSGWAWQTPGQSEWNFLFDKATSPSILRGFDAQPYSTVQFSEDGKTALASRSNGTGEIWSTNFDTQTAERRAQINSQGSGAISFSSDQRVVISRSEGGYYQLWSRDGLSLGALGKLGATLVWSTYDAACRRFLLWDGDGERLDFQRGFAISIFGFLPERSCSPDKSPFRKVLDSVIP